jgi:CheY-like chemotaxis protein
MGKKTLHLIIAGNIPELAFIPKLLDQQGFSVQSCKDGSEVLQFALATPPQLIVVDVNLALLPLVRLVKILRSNPRTLEIPFFVIGRQEDGKDIVKFLQRDKDVFVVRPFNQEQMTNRISRLLKQSVHVGELADGKSEIEGSLNQISLVDLLQIFNLNRKDGILSLDCPEGKATVYLLEGNVVNTRAGDVDGEKAFFRLLDWEKGSFWFTPAVVPCEIKINRRTDHLIMEGLRQKDEMASQGGTLPGRATRLKLRMPKDHLPKGLRPSTQEILALLEYYDKVTDILDKSTLSDYDILHILRVLLEKGLIEKTPKAETGREKDVEPLLSAETVLSIRDCLGERDSLLEKGSAKLVVLTSSAQELARFTEVFKGIEEFEPETGWRGSDTVFQVGDFGRLQTTDNFFLRLFSLSSDPAGGPLWAPFCRRVIGVISLHPYTGKTAAESFFQRRRTPVFRVRLDKPQGDEICLLPEDRAGLRKLLANFASVFLAKHIVTREIA